MKQKELELLVSLGHIEKIEVRRPQGAASGWLVIAWPGENALRRFAPELETAKGEPREFASLDAACRTLEAIGVATFQVFNK